MAKEATLPKKIVIEYGGNQYTLEYDKAVVSRLERAGVDVTEPSRNPATNIPLMFEGAFAKNHRITTKLANEIYDHISNRTELIRALYEMAAEQINGLLEDPEESEGNASWKVVG